MSAIKIVKNNSLGLAYDKLNDEGKLMKSNQKFSYIPEDATADDLLEVGNLIGDALAYATRELSQTITYIITEV